MASEKSNSLLHSRSWFYRFLNRPTFLMVVFTEVFVAINYCSSCLRLASDLFSKSLVNLLCLPLVVCPCSYKKSKGHLCETSCLLGVLRPFTNPHSNNSSCPLCGPGASIQDHTPIQDCTPINRHVSWTDTPHHWERAPCLVRSLVLIVVTPHGCVDGFV